MLIYLTDKALEPGISNYTSHRHKLRFFPFSMVSAKYRLNAIKLSFWVRATIKDCPYITERFVGAIPRAKPLT